MGHSKTKAKELSNLWVVSSIKAHDVCAFSSTRYLLTSLFPTTMKINFYLKKTS